MNTSDLNFTLGSTQTGDIYNIIHGLFVKGSMRGLVKHCLVKTYGQKYTDSMMEPVSVDEWPRTLTRVRGPAEYFRIHMNERETPLFATVSTGTPHITIYKI